MNQILITGDEPVATQATQKKTKQKTVLPVNVIVIFYAISIIILGICMISGSVYANTKINETVEANIRPVISIEQNEDNTISIKITHIRGIKSVTYSWNDEEEVLIDGRSRKSITETINLIGGVNTLNVTAIEENGRAQTLEKTIKAENIPEIETIESVDNGVRLVVKSKDELDYLQYSWDDGAMQKIEIGQKQYDGIISAPRGKHILKVEIVTVNKIKAKLVKEVIGDTVPVVNVQPLYINDKPTFVIDAEDDEGITTMSIIHNGGEKQTINVNSKTFHEEIQMVEGETNTIIVVATNVNGLEEIKRIRVKENDN